MPSLTVTTASVVLVEANARRKALTIANTDTVAADTVIVRLGQKAPPTATDGDYIVGASKIISLTLADDGPDIKGRVQVISAAGSPVVIWNETPEDNLFAQ